MQVEWEGTAPPIFVTKGLGSKILTGAALVAAPFTGGATLAANAARIAATTGAKKLGTQFLGGAAKKIGGSKIGQSIASKFGKVPVKGSPGAIAGKLPSTTTSINPTQTQLPSAPPPVAVTPSAPVAGNLDDVWAGQGQTAPAPTSTPAPPKLENPPVATSMADASSAKGSITPSTSEQTNVFDTAVNERGSIKPVDAPPKDWSQGFDVPPGNNNSRYLPQNPAHAQSTQTAAPSSPVGITSSTRQNPTTLKPNDPTLQTAETESKSREEAISDANTYNIPILGKVDKDKAQWAVGAGYVGYSGHRQASANALQNQQAEQQRIEGLTEQARSKADTGGGQVAVAA